jgi:acyl-CoA thioesterase-1
MFSGMLRLLLIATLFSFHAPALAGSGVILVYGDSLSAGYGVANGKTWVDLLSARLDTEGRDYRVVNASISGETSYGGLARIDGVLKTHQPDIVILGLGGNDGLRALPIPTIRQNLAQIIQSAQRQGSKVVLLGIRIPPNYGPVYTRAFTDIYGALATDYKLALVPFLLQGVATQAGMMQADGIHPAERAQTHILDNVWPVLRPLL